MGPGWAWGSGQGSRRLAPAAARRRCLLGGRGLCVAPVTCSGVILAIISCAMLRSRQAGKQGGAPSAGEVAREAVTSERQRR